VVLLGPQLESQDTARKAALHLQAQAATVTTKPVVAFVEYSDYDYDFEISFAPYKVDFIQVRGWTCTQRSM